jgi:hypothetical protein
MNIATVKAEKTPIDGRYILCSNITLLSGMMLDSSRRLMKNQIMPKEMIRVCGAVSLYRNSIYILKPNINARKRNDDKTSVLKKEEYLE